MHSVAVHARASHPFAAMLLFDFFLSEGQQLLADRNFVPASTKVATPYANMPLRFIDAAESLDKQDQWTKIYEDTIVKRSR